MRIEHQALIAFGIIVFIIGLIASFYVEHPYPYQTEYPYQQIGLVLALAGIIVTTLGFLLFLWSENFILKHT